MGLWLNSGERGIVCTQAGPNWAIIGPIPTSLLKRHLPDIFKDGGTGRNETTIVDVILHGHFWDTKRYGVSPP